MAFNEKPWKPLMQKTNRSSSTGDGIGLLANQVDDRLGILSFYVEGVHYNLVTTLLNDCFGIQVRGGCS